MTDVWHVLFLNLIFFCVLDDFTPCNTLAFDMENYFPSSSFSLPLHGARPPAILHCIVTSSLQPYPIRFRYPFTRYRRHSCLECTAPFMVSVAAYVVGLLFYAFHFPECKWPGKFDTWGSSHQVRYFIWLTVRVEWADADGT